MKKKNVISPALTHSRRPSEIPASPTLINTGVRHTDSYECTSMFAQASAARLAASRTAALPDSVRRNERSGVSSPRTQAVRPDIPGAEATGSLIA